jgi:hypothetical protein
MARVLAVTADAEPPIGIFLLAFPGVAIFVIALRAFVALSVLVAMSAMGLIASMSAGGAILPPAYEASALCHRNLLEGYAAIILANDAARFENAACWAQFLQKPLRSMRCVGQSDSPIARTLTPRGALLRPATIW